MPPESGSRVDLAKYRIETAKENLSAARILLDSGLFKDANNRAYYAVFHAVNAVHAVSGEGFKNHKDAIANFNKNYIHSKVFPRDLGRRISKLSEIRRASDYDDFYLATRNEAENCITTATEFIPLVEDYIEKAGNN